MRKPRTASTTLSSHDDKPTGIPLVDAETDWRTARMLAIRALHPFAPAISALVPVFIEDSSEFDAQMGQTLYMATDKYYRCYIGVTGLNKLIAEASAVSLEAPCKSCGATQHHRLSYVAGVICHETMHPLNRHNARGNEINAAPTIFNIAGDCEINDDLFDIFAAVASEDTSAPRLCMPHWVCKPSTYDFKDYLDAETYYYDLLDNAEKNGGGHGKCCGSGAGAGTMPWDKEDPSMEDCDTPGVPSADQHFIEREVAEKVKESATRGKMPAGMVSWADKVLAKPKYDWRREFRKAIRGAVGTAWGFDAPTYRRFARDCAASNYNVIAPSHVKVVPVLGVVLDTSGSMGGFNEGSPLYEAVSEIEGIIRSVDAKIDVLDVDASANENEIKQITTAKGMQLRGFGGTDMRVGIEVFRNRKKGKRPSVVVVLTDGETPWPVEKPREFSLIIGLVGNPSDTVIKSCPSWAKVVRIEDDGKTKKRRKAA